MVSPAKIRNCLHLVVRSSSDAIERCRSQFAEGDAVLFLDDGVMHFTGGSRKSFGSDLPNCHFLAMDLEARGLLQAARDAGAPIVCDSDFAGLLQNYDFCVTWK
jgi:sulfur relay protein TusB/DsrH